MQDGVIGDQHQCSEEMADTAFVVHELRAADSLRQHGANVTGCEEASFSFPSGKIMNPAFLA